MRTVRKEKAKNQATPLGNRHPESLPDLASEAKPFEVVGLGENSLDLLAVAPRFPEPDTKLALRHLAPLVGGQTLTAMVACARLGRRARYIGGVGSDDEGRLVLETLNREGVERQVRIRPGARTRRAVIVVDAGTGSRTVLEDRDPAVALGPHELIQEVVTSGRVLLVDARDPGLSALAARWARAAGVPVVLDVEQPAAGIEALLRLVDIVIAARSFLSALTGIRSTGRALGQVARLSRASVVVVTLGSEGSLALADGREIRTKGFRVRAVDTTGAGDAFRGGFLAAWLAADKNVSLRGLLAEANAVAALNCLAYGSLAGLPTQGDVEAFVTRVRRGKSN